MKHLIDGFSQEYAVTLKKQVTCGGKTKTIQIDCTDLAILRWFVDSYPTLPKMSVEGREYAWVLHKTLAKDMPLLAMNSRTSIERMKKLVEFNILDYKIIKDGGTYSLYTFGHNFDRIITLDGNTVPSKTDTPEPIEHTPEYVQTYTPMSFQTDSPYTYERTPLHQNKQTPTYVQTYTPTSEKTDNHSHSNVYPSYVQTYTPYTDKRTPPTQLNAYPTCFLADPPHTFERIPPCVQKDAPYTAERTPALFQIEPLLAETPITDDKTADNMGNTDNSDTFSEVEQEKKKNQKEKKEYKSNTNTIDTLYILNNNNNIYRDTIRDIYTNNAPAREDEPTTSQPTHPTQPRKPSASVLTERFDRFWKAYPRKVSKGQALKTWMKLAPDEELTVKIIDAITTAKERDRRFQSEQYTPHPSTWLNGREWENEYAPTSAVKEDGCNDGKLRTTSADRPFKPSTGFMPLPAYLAG